jgi:Tol biopolymer transport system component
MLRRADRFDLAVTATVVLLLTAIGIVVVRGDQIGIVVQQFSPAETASSRSTIQITLDEPPNPLADNLYFNITPTVPGTLSAVGNSLTFRPSAPFKPQQTYQVTLRAGLPAVTGRTLKQAVAWQFRIRAPRVVYLGTDANLYAVDPAAPSVPQKLTDSQVGIGSYDILPDGSQIVYAETPNQDATSLYVLDVAAKTTELLYRCENALCANPAWRPDGGAVAFDQVTNSGSVARLPRVWLYDLTAKAARPLFQDGQIVANLSRWSPDGTLIAVASASDPELIVHDFATGKESKIPTREGETANFSPDGRHLLLRKLVSPSAGALAMHLVVVDLSTDPYTIHDLIPDSDPGNDIEAVWRADSKTLLTTRRSPYAKDATQGSQLTSLDATNGSATTLYADATHRHRALALSPADDAVLLQRLAVGNVGGLWLYHLLSGEFTRIGDNGTDPRWLP